MFEQRIISISTYLSKLELIHTELANSSSNAMTGKLNTGALNFKGDLLKYRRSLQETRDEVLESARQVRSLDPMTARELGLESKPYERVAELIRRVLEYLEGTTLNRKTAHLALGTYRYLLDEIRPTLGCEDALAAHDLRHASVSRSVLDSQKIKRSVLDKHLQNEWRPGAR